MEWITLGSKMVGDGNLFLFPGSSHYPPPPCGKKEVPARVEGGEENPVGKHAGTHATRESTHQSQTRISSPGTLTPHTSGVGTCEEPTYYNVTVFVLSATHIHQFSVYYPVWKSALNDTEKLLVRAKSEFFLLITYLPGKIINVNYQ
jgi:hypothetical protein